MNWSNLPRNLSVVMTAFLLEFQKQEENQKLLQSMPANDRSVFDASLLIIVSNLLNIALPTREEAQHLMSEPQEDVATILGDFKTQGFAHTDEVKAVFNTLAKASHDADFAEKLGLVDKRELEIQPERMITQRDMDEHETKWETLYESWTRVCQNVAQESSVTLSVSSQSMDVPLRNQAATERYFPNLLK